MGKVFIGQTEITPMIVRGTSTGVVLPDQTDSAGKFLQTDGENLSWESAVKNNSDVSQALAVGHNARAESFASTSIGANAVAESEYGVSIGYGAWVTSDRDDGKNILTRYSTALGYSATVTKPNSVALVSDGGVYASQGVAIGYGASTRTADSISIGNGASTGTDTPSEDITGVIAIGKNAKAIGSDSVVIGSNAKSNSPQGANVVIGPNSQINGYSFNSTAIGIGAQAQNYDATAIGRNAIAGAQYSFAAGYSAQTNPVYCDDSIDDSQPVVAVGFEAMSRSNDTIAIGRSVSADGPFSIVIGQNSTVAEGNKYGIAIGNNARGATESIAIGYITSGSMNSVTIGSRANCGSSTGVSIGYASQANSDGLESIAIGGYAATNKSHAIALGYSTKASSENAIAIGKKAEAKTSHAVAIGGGAKVVGDEGIAVGNSSVSARHGIALGTRANANDFGTVSIGLNSESTSTNAVAIGNQSYARGQDSVALGSSAIVDEGAGFAVQLGIGTNYDANTLQFKDYKLLYENGVIPHSRLTNLNSPSNGQTLVYDENEDMLVWSDAAGGISEVNWGDITGDISDQEDLNDKFDDIHSNFQNINEDIQNLESNVNTRFSGVSQSISDMNDTLMEMTTKDESLQSQINTLSSIGQFLAIWDCDTGIARYLNEGFEYQTGNYFIIGTIAEGEGAVNYMPDGNIYPGKVEATEEDIKVSDMWFYDGEHWIYLANHERAIAVDAELDSTSSNPVENKAITKHLGEFELVLDNRFDDIRNSIDETNSSIEELKNNPSVIPQLTNVYTEQVNTESKQIARMNKEDFMGGYGEIVIQTNLDKDMLVSQMYNLYVTISRYKSLRKGKSFNYGDEENTATEYYYNRPNFSIMNDMRFKVNQRMYCYRFVTDSSYPEENPNRYIYFYLFDEYTDMQALLESELPVYCWYGYACSGNQATCLNALRREYTSGYDVDSLFHDMYEIDDSLERYEPGDISTFANCGGIANIYCDKMQCKEYTKDGKSYFFWAERDEWEGGGCGYGYGEYMQPVPYMIPEHMDTLTNLFDEVQQLDEAGFVFVKNRSDLNYYRLNGSFEDFQLDLQDYTLQGAEVDDGQAIHWPVYWFDFPIMPILLKDCEVKAHTDASNEDYAEHIPAGDWAKLEYLHKNGLLHCLKDNEPIEIRIPYNTYYLWMRFISLQKRCVYGDPSDWNDSSNPISNPMYPWNKNNLRVGVNDYGVMSKKAFSRPRGSYRCNHNTGKISELIQFNLVNHKDMVSGKRNGSPITKKLILWESDADSGLRD